MHKYATNKYIKALPNNVAAAGATEPILTVLDVGGFRIRDLFLMGLNKDCGSLIVDSETRATEAQRVLEPAYRTSIRQLPNTGDWELKYDRRDPDGSTPDRFITKVVGNDGRRLR